MSGIITAQKEDWQAALGRVTGAVAKRSTIEVLSHVLVERSGKGVVLSATDLNLRASAYLHSEASGDFDPVCLHAEQLRSIVSVADEQIEIAIDLHINPGTVKVTSGMSAWEVPCLDGSMFPAVDLEWQSEGWMFAAGVLPQLLKSVQHAAANDDTKLHLCGVNLKAEGSQITACSSDGHRLSVSGRSVDNIAGFTDILLHSSAVKQLASLTGGVEYRQQKQGGRNAASFSGASGSIAYTVQLLNLAFPDYRKVIPTLPCVVTVDVEQITAAVEACGIMAEGHSRAVRLQVDGSTLRVSAHSKQGTAIASAPCTAGDGDHLDVAINSKYLLQALQSLSGEINIKHGDKQQPIVIFPTDFGNFDERLEVLMPVRI